MGILRAFYFTYFLAFGIYSPYLNLYLKQRGFTGVQIGFLNTLIPIVSMVIPPIAGAIADRKNRRRQLLAGSVFLGIPFLALVWLVGPGSFPWAVAMMLAFSVFSSPITPLADGITLETLRGKAHLYASIRIWGSLGYALAVLTIGRVLERAGWGSVFGLYVLAGLLAGIIATRVPDGSRVAAETSRQERTPAGMRTLLANYSLLSFLLIILLARVGATIYYNFFSIFLDSLKIKPGLIGVSWTVGVVSEIAVMLFSGWVLQRIGYRTLFFLGVAGSAARWYLYSIASTPGSIVLIQLLHGLTFGALQIGAISIVDSQTPPGLKASGQSLLSAVNMGLGGVAGALVGGLLLDRIGIRALFAVSAWVALAATALFAIWAAVTRNSGHGKTPSLS